MDAKDTHAHLELDAMKLVAAAQGGIADAFWQGGRLYVKPEHDDRYFRFDPDEVLEERPYPIRMGKPIPAKVLRFTGESTELPPADGRRSCAASLREFNHGR